MKKREKKIKIKKHFNREARKFDKVIVKLIPHYQKMVELLVELVPFGNKQIKVIDLGCGTGTVSQNILKRFPQVQLTCVDISDKMLKYAKCKLKKYDNQVNWVVKDLSNFNFKERYDAVLSSLALHHLYENGEKQEFYKKIYNSLNVGGVFYNADVVLGPGEKMQKFYIDKWKKYMSENYSEKVIKSKWLPRYNNMDSPAKLFSQLKWLKNIGFKEVDVVWKYYNYAVYGGRK